MNCNFRVSANYCRFVTLTCKRKVMKMKHEISVKVEKAIDCRSLGMSLNKKDRKLCLFTTSQSGKIYKSHFRHRHRIS